MSSRKNRADNHELKAVGARERKRALLTERRATPSRRYSLRISTLAARLRVLEARAHLPFRGHKRASAARWDRDNRDRRCRRPAPPTTVTATTTTMTTISIAMSNDVTNNAPPVIAKLSGKGGVCGCVQKEANNRHSIGASRTIVINRLFASTTDSWQFLCAHKTKSSPSTPPIVAHIRDCLQEIRTSAA